MLTSNATHTAQPDAGSTFPPLDRETRTALDTDAAAWHLGRQPQTLRVWACRQNGPIKPVRVHGRLLWRTAEIRKLLGVPQ